MIRWVKGAPLLFCVLSLASTRGYSQSTFLVVEHPQALTVYNRYQQLASPEELVILKPFTPMRVLQEEGFLGDGVSPCTMVETGGIHLYLARKKDGGLIYSGDAGLVKRYQGAVKLQDSVVVLRTNSLRIVAPAGNSSRTLSAGERFSRVFEHRNKVYCSIASGPSGYGWVSLGDAREGKDWRLLGKTVGASPIGDEVIGRISARVSEANHVLSRFYDFLNKESAEPKKAPQWIMATSPGTITVDLRETNKPWAFQQSTTYLATNIENLILGTGWDVVHTAGHIEVRQR